MKGGKILMDEGAEPLPEKAHRVLQAAAVEAYGMPGAYVSRDAVMQRVSISDPEEFRAIAEYLEGRGWIAEAASDYRVFVVTMAGIDAAIS
jgi:RIO-like serine/threonine protein kinase